MRRDATGDFYFERPDGRAVPRGGYRADDMVDDFATDWDDGGSAHFVPPPAGWPSAEGYEVRETRGLYRIGERAA